MALTRREMLKLSALAGGALLLPLERRVLAADTNRIAESQLPPPFTIPFAVPAVLKPVRSEKARDLYSLTMREGLAEIIPGYRTRVWGERVRVIAKFGPHPGKYMIHCHNLVHEDHDMMGQFIVGDGGPDPISTAPCQPLPAPRM